MVKPFCVDITLVGATFTSNIQEQEARSGKQGAGSGKQEDYDEPGAAGTAQ
jgi:hypothetical protein